MLSDFDINISTGSAIAGLAISIAFFGVWLTKRIKKIRSVKRHDIENSKYKKSQLVGIVLIFLFIIPWSYLVLSNLAKGALLLSMFIFSLFNVPNWLENILEGTTFAGASFMVFSGMYFICEYLWPKKEIMKEENG